MKRETLQKVSLDDQRRRILIRQLVQRSGNKPAEVIEWLDGLNDDDQKILFVGLTIALAEMAASVVTLTKSLSPVLGLMVRDIETRGKDEDTDRSGETC